jgi:hypothetical protein
VLTSQVGADVAGVLVHRWSTERTSGPVSPIARLAGYAWCLAPFPVDGECESVRLDLVYRSRSIPGKGTSSGRCWRGRSAASHSCSA